MRRNIFLLFLSALLLMGCGYRFGLGELPNRYCTIAIPYVVGDLTGELTATLVREIAKSGAFRYLNSGAQITLQVTIIEVYDDNIGFRYDRHKNGKRENDIIPSETRITLVAEVSVVDNCSGCVVLGPGKIYASVDFDHDYYYGSRHINELSLGQLTDIDAAYDSVQSPLYQALAEKIVDYVINSW